MSIETWIRCDGCGNSLQLDPYSAEPPVGWFTLERQQKQEEEERQEAGAFLIVYPGPPRRQHHVCSATCLGKYGAVEKVET